MFDIHAMKNKARNYKVIPRRILSPATLVLLIVLAGGLIWYLFRGKKPAVPLAGNDVAFLAREAGQRLAASSRPAIARLPVVLVVGDSQASKTTVIVNSGLNPELLSGQDREMENGPVPATPCAKTKPVTTSGLRLEVVLPPEWSAGIQEWKVR